ncbi:MAG TPA: outer membrane protein assembly factor BamD [Candidatus Omnitrophota bacterium]|nr:outer membrane protein assembly factor BamD [Candidatus Omnitrophota bacterium]HQJ15136.1 outer membrane protein assembly factor BamD [Candidatus Omnitrophota bacterium]
MKSLIIALLIAFVFSCVPAHAYWIWTPKTGKFVNPKTEVKPTPGDQLEFAVGLFESKSYEEAKKEFRKLIKNYPKAVEAAESQYYLGMIEEAQGNPYEAFLAYQKVVEKYPFSERIGEIIEREFKIGEQFMAGAKRKAFGMALPVDNPAIEIFTKVVENSTYGPLAPKAQYKLGLVLKSMERYYEAEEAFNKVITAYPESEWVEPAKFQLASTRASVSRSAAYDQGATREAKEKFEEFVIQHPDAILAPEAERNIRALNAKEAESLYSAALFYEKQKAWNAARLYYRNIIANYPDSSWAAKAAGRLETMEKRGH